MTAKIGNIQGEWAVWQPLSSNIVVSIRILNLTITKHEDKKIIHNAISEYECFGSPIISKINNSIIGLNYDTDITDYVERIRNEKSNKIFSI